MYDDFGGCEDFCDDLNDWETEQCFQDECLERELEYPEDYDADEWDAD